MSRMLSAFPPLHIVLPKHSHTHTVILLHGRGSCGREFAAELFEACSSDGLTLPEHFPSWRWVFPTAKKRYSTMFQEEMNEWFDTISLIDIGSREELQVRGLSETLQYLWGLIDDEVRLTPEERLILGGISQGCATSLHALLFGRRKLGAFVGISGWMPFADHMAKIVKDGESCSAIRVLEILRKKIGLAISPLAGDGEISSAMGTPLFLGHGVDDEVVSVELGEQIYGLLSGLGMHVVWKDYQECGHWVKEPEELDHIVTFLKNSV